MLVSYSSEPWTSCLISEIDKTSMKQKRAGIIVYTYQPPAESSPRTEIEDGPDLEFVLGLDASHGDLTDLGGRVEKRETPIIAAIREFQEESQGVFGYIRPEDLENSLAIFSVDLLLIFVKLIFDRSVISNAFKRRIERIQNLEVSRLIILDTEEFQRAVSGKYHYKIYDPVRTLLSNIPELETFLTSLP